jgi:hypothetical protein
MSVIATYIFGEVIWGTYQVRNERNTSRSQYARALNLTPFLHMPGDNLFNIIGGMYAPNVQRPILALECAHTAHVVAVIGMLVAPKAVDVRREEVGGGGQAMQVLAVDALGANAACEEEAEVGAGGLVGFSVAAVFGDVAASLSGGLAEVFVFAVAAAPGKLLAVVPR